MDKEFEELAFNDHFKDVIGVIIGLNSAYVILVLVVIGVKYGPKIKAHFSKYAKANRSDPESSAGLTQSTGSSRDTTPPPSSTPIPPPYSKETAAADDSDVSSENSDSTVPPYTSTDQTQGDEGTSTNTLVN